MPVHPAAAAVTSTRVVESHDRVPSDSGWSVGTVKAATSMRSTAGAALSRLMPLQCPRLVHTKCVQAPCAGTHSPETCAEQEDPMPKVADYILSRLSAWGVRRIYGYPGDGINGFLGALDRAEGNPEIIQPRHEE